MSGKVLAGLTALALALGWGAAPAAAKDFWKEQRKYEEKRHKEWVKYHRKQAHDWDKYQRKQAKYYYRGMY